MAGRWRNWPRSSRRRAATQRLSRHLQRLPQAAWVQAGSCRPKLAIWRHQRRPGGRQGRRAAGAGRQRKGDTIDPAVGLLLRAKVGDRMAQGDPLVEIHARSQAAADAVRDALLAAYHWSDQPPAPPSLLMRAHRRLMGFSR